MATVTTTFDREAKTLRTIIVEDKPGRPWKPQTFFGERCGHELRRRAKFRKGQARGSEWFVYSRFAAKRRATRCEVVLWNSLPNKMKEAP